MADEVTGRGLLSKPHARQPPEPKHCWDYDKRFRKTDAVALRLEKEYLPKLQRLKDLKATGEF